MGVQYATNEVETLEEIQQHPAFAQHARRPEDGSALEHRQVRRVNIPGEVAHYNISRVYDVHVNVEGRDVGSVASDVERALAKLKPIPGVNMTVRGPVTTMRSGDANAGRGADRGDGAGVSGDAGPVPLVHRSADHHARRAFGIDRRVGGAVGDGHDPQHPIADGHADDDRRGRQQQHFARRVRQPTPRPRATASAKRPSPPPKFACGRF